MDTIQVRVSGTNNVVIEFPDFTIPLAQVALAFSNTILCKFNLQENQTNNKFSLKSTMRMFSAMLDKKNRTFFVDFDRGNCNIQLET